MRMPTLRQKVVTALVLMVFVLGIMFLFTGYTLIRSMVLRQAQEYVESALRVARSEYDHRLDTVHLILQLISSKTTLLEAMKRNDDTFITARLKAMKEHYGLDYITVLDKDGRVFTRAGYPHNIGDIASVDSIVAEAMNGIEARGTVVIPREILEVLAEGLAQKAHLDIVPTPKSKISVLKRIDSGMALEAAVPIWDGDKQIGSIYGGVLLNRNDALVDEIQETVFHNWFYEGRPLGAVTIFDWDTRIATTVRNVDNSRAIGTTVSSEVYDRVLTEGLPWVGKAFVVRDWYLSAYEPIYDPARKIIGIIYVGVLEKKFADYEATLILRFGLTAALWAVAALILSYGLLSRFVRSIKRLARASEQVAEGQFPAKIHEERQYWEIYHLTRAFNAMVQQIKERNDRLREMNSELSQINEDLKKQNKNYMELLGFVVHELKTPINSITFGLSSMMAQSVGQLNERQKKLADIIMRNASYLNAMIRNYLDLSRIEKGELVITASKVLLDEDVIEPIRYQLAPQLEVTGKTIVDQVPKGVEVEVDLDLMKVVVNNLLSNAIKYGNPGTEIRLLFEDLGQAVQVDVWNEGPGIAAASLKHLFDKFTDLVSKNAMGRRGTGLGLFITKEIIEKHGGAIWAESEEGKWIKFRFRFPKTMAR